MTIAVEKIVDQVRALPKSDLDEFLAWLAEYELQQSDEWDREMQCDRQPGGRLQSAIALARDDIATGRTKPLDEVLDDN
ncbi:MAG: hypothetical protein LLG00_16320 [Planctomycetaceae bacterium]|nr:hypothetical protein [Planctomycetaceae bacterium]